MKTLQDYKEYLLSRGYAMTEEDCYDDEGYYFSSFTNKDGGYISLISENGDLMDSIVTEAKINLPICSSPKDYSGYYYDYNDDPGIILNFYSDTHSLSRLSYCIDLQLNGILDHEIKITQAHLDNLKWIRENFDPIMRRYDFITADSSTYYKDYIGDDICLCVFYRHSSIDLDIVLYTDTFTGDLRVYGYPDEDIRRMDMNSNNIFILREIICDEKSDIKPEFEYLFSTDPKETKESWQIILDMYSKMARKASISDIDVSKIPDKYMKRYKEYMEAYENI